MMCDVKQDVMKNFDKDKDEFSEDTLGNLKILHINVARKKA